MTRSAIPPDTRDALNRSTNTSTNNAAFSPSPITAPTMRTLFGMIRRSQSVTATTDITMMNDTTSRYSGTGPYFKKNNTVAAPANNSYTGYLQEMGLPHVAHFPRRTAKLMSGTSSAHPRRRPQ